MTQRTRLSLLCLVFIAAGGLLLADGEFRFIEKGDTVDLSELAEGETREFGSGEHRLVATRSGDVVSLSRPDADGERTIDISCTIGQDTCEVITAGDDDHVMVKIQKTRVCSGDDCDGAEIEVMALAGGPGIHAIGGAHGGHGGHGVHEMRHVVIDRSECDDDNEECNSFTWSSDSPGGSMVFITDDGHPTLIGGDQTVLSCPEGDATLTVAKDEADETFLCPKHSVPLERLPKREQRRIRVGRGN